MSDHRDDELVFYSNPMSRGRIARWMLEECGARYRTEWLDYGTSMKSSAFAAVNPMGKVPAIVHRGHTVTECAAICAYLADAFPAAGLAPATDARADYYRWLFFAAGPFEAATTNAALGLSVPEDKHSMVGYGHLGLVLDTLEAAVAGKTHLAGSAFSAADVYVGSQIGFGLQFGTLEKREALVAYWEAISDRDAYRRASDLDNAAMASSP